MKILIIALLLLQGCSHLFYQPTKPHFVDPKRFNLVYKDFYFKSQDGTKLHGWFFPARGKIKGTIVQFHGNAQNISSHFYSLIWLVHEGYNLFTFDYRGYGKSEGVPDQEGLYNDALSALNLSWIYNQDNGHGKYIVYGQSLGGAVLLRAIADFKLQNKVDLLVQDSTFSSYKAIAFDKLTDHWFLIPISPIAPLLVSNSYASQDVFDQIKAPTLVIVGEKDQIVPAKFGKKIFENINPTKKWIWDLPDGGHIDVFHHAKNEYRHKFLQFLDELSPR